MTSTVQFDKLCHVIDLGCIEYSKALKIQENYVEQCLQNEENILLLCEHPPVLTRGRLTDGRNLLLSQKKLQDKGIAMHDISRGGDITLHAPGQLIIYPIFHLGQFGKDLKRYLYNLEQVTIEVLKDFGIVATRISKHRGVWVKSKKIASVGIGVRKWISFHGLAINVNTDLNLFSMIKPCGLNVDMTSVKEVLEKEIDMQLVKEKIINKFCHVFGLDIKIFLSEAKGVGCD